MAWTLLIVAALLEIVWATALKQTQSSLRPIPTLVVIVAATASLVLLGVSLRTLPVGTAYAVWVGIGAAGVTLAGIVAFQESVTPMRLAFIALILIGVAGLRAIEG